MKGQGKTKAMSRTSPSQPGILPGLYFYKVHFKGRAIPFRTEDFSAFSDMTSNTKTGSKANFSEKWSKCDFETEIPP